MYVAFFIDILYKNNNTFLNTYNEIDILHFFFQECKCTFPR